MVYEKTIASTLNTGVFIHVFVQEIVTSVNNSLRYLYQATAEAYFNNNDINFTKNKDIIEYHLKTFTNKEDAQNYCTGMGGELMLSYG